MFKGLISKRAEQSEDNLLRLTASTQSWQQNPFNCSVAARKGNSAPRAPDVGGSQIQRVGDGLREQRGRPSVTPALAEDDDFDLPLDDDILSLLDNGPGYSRQPLSPLTKQPSSQRPQFPFNASVTDGSLSQPTRTSKPLGKRDPTGFLQNRAPSSAFSQSAAASVRKLVPDATAAISQTKQPHDTTTAMSKTKQLQDAVLANIPKASATQQMNQKIFEFKRHPRPTQQLDQTERSTLNTGEPAQSRASASPATRHPIAEPDAHIGRHRDLQGAQRSQTPRRKLPGPAGTLPRLSPKEKLLVLRRPNTPVKTPLRAAPALNSIVQSNSPPASPAKKPRLTSQNSSADDWESLPWQQMLKYHGQYYSIGSIAPETFRLSRVTVLCKEIGKADPDGGSSALFRDPNTEVPALLHRTVMEKFRKEMTPGCVVELEDVALLKPTKFIPYLNIVLRNVIRVWKVDGGVAHSERSIGQANNSTAMATRTAIENGQESSRQEMDDHVSGNTDLGDNESPLQQEQNACSPDHSSRLEDHSHRASTHTRLPVNDTTPRQSFSFTTVRQFQSHYTSQTNTALYTESSELREQIDFSADRLQQDGAQCEPLPLTSHAPVPDVAPAFDSAMDVDFVEEFEEDFGDIDDDVLDIARQLNQHRPSGTRYDITGKVDGGKFAKPNSANHAAEGEQPNPSPELFEQLANHPLPSTVPSRHALDMPGGLQAPQMSDPESYDLGLLNDESAILNLMEGLDDWDGGDDF
ncbi:hypothetical protein BC832DRAFT_280136 [Gaertneriomyces semiglobifer]|nr:hypothetical protein BC832DRAFT_280136 [Gaertneriomyces semiglobifer]